METGGKDGATLELSNCFISFIIWCVMGLWFFFLKKKRAQINHTEAIKYAGILFHINQQIAE